MNQSSRTNQSLHTDQARVVESWNESCCTSDEFKTLDVGTAALLYEPVQGHMQKRNIDELLFGPSYPYVHLFSHFLLSMLLHEMWAFHFSWEISYAIWAKNSYCILIRVICANKTIRCRRRIQTHVPLRTQNLNLIGRPLCAIAERKLSHVLYTAYSPIALARVCCVFVVTERVSGLLNP